MIHRSFDEWHSQDCTCSRCRPPMPSDPRLRSADHANLCGLAGVATAIALIEILHLLVGLPGPGVLFGQ